MYLNRAIQLRQYERNTPLNEVDGLRGIVEQRDDLVDILLPLGQVTVVFPVSAVLFSVATGNGNTHHIVPLGSGSFETEEDYFLFNKMGKGEKVCECSAKRHPRRYGNPAPGTANNSCKSGNFRQD